MENRRNFLKTTGIIGAGALLPWEMGAGRAHAAPKPATAKLTKDSDNN